MPQKKSWKGATLTPVVRARGVYSDRGTLLDSTHGVSLVMEVRGDGQKENGRWVVQHMTPEMARRRAAELVTAAEEAERLDKRG